MFHYNYRQHNCTNFLAKVNFLWYLSGRLNTDTRVLQNATKAESYIEILVLDLSHISQKALVKVSGCAIKMSTFALKFKDDT